MDRGTIYVIDRDTITCDRSWYNLSDGSWYDHMMDRGTIYVIDRDTINYVNVLPQTNKKCQCFH